MRCIRTAVATLAMLVGVLAIVAPAQAATPAQLLARYQPVTVLDPLEPFAPTSVNSFVADSALETRSAGGTWTLVDAHPSTATLPTRPSEACIANDMLACYRLNQQPCSASDGTAGVACYRAAWLADDPRSVVYGRVAYRPRRIVVQYWYFYYDDLYSYDYPPDDLFWQAHEGDWEAVTVVLRRGTQHPLYAAYSQHCTGVRRPWGKVTRRGTHPVDHVAIGSHANLFDRGSHAVATQCIPPQALAILQAQGLPAPVDRAADGEALGPSLPGVSPTAIRRVDTWHPRWLRFAGLWGENQVFHAPPPIGTVAAGDAPQSPTWSGLWKTPVGTTRHWPVG
jgi:hypothetical protein